MKEKAIFEIFTTADMLAALEKPGIIPLAILERSSLCTFTNRSLSFWDKLTVIALAGHSELKFVVWLQAIWF